MNYIEIKNNFFDIKKYIVYPNQSELSQVEIMINNDFNKNIENLSKKDTYSIFIENKKYSLKIENYYISNNNFELTRGKYFWCNSTFKIYSMLNIKGYIVD